MEEDYRYNPQPSPYIKKLGAIVEDSYYLANGYIDINGEKNIL